MKRYLIIDGNYFAQRVLGQLNSKTQTNNLVSELECKRFKNELYKSLVNLYNTFNSEQHTLIDNIIFCTDTGSWRKKVPGFKPFWYDKVYGISDNQVINYKEQRKAKKEESPINYDNFYALYREFADEVKTMGVNVISIGDCEGDDLIAMIGNKFNSAQDKQGIIFATDGDLEQLVTDKMLYFKNVRSKACPNGEIVTTVLTYDVFIKPRDSFFVNNIQTKYFDDLTSLNITGYNKIKRELNSGVRIATASKLVLTKCFCGDAKDNIFALFGWLSSTGTRKYSLSEKQLEKAIGELGYYGITESVAKNILETESIKKRLIMILAKQQDFILSEDELAKVYEHLEHNIRMNRLSIENIPSELQSKFNIEYKQIFDNEQQFPDKKIIEYLNKSHINDNIYIESLEDLL